jgi:hypothetical protein
MKPFDEELNEILTLVEKGTISADHAEALIMKLLSPSLPTDEEIREKVVLLLIEHIKLPEETLEKLIVTFEEYTDWFRDTYHPKVDWEKFEYEFYGFMAYRRDNNIETSDQDIVKWVKSKLK